jgi:hypothetical protein
VIQSDAMKSIRRFAGNLKIALRANAAADGEPCTYTGAGNRALQADPAMIFINSRETPPSLKDRWCLPFVRILVLFRSRFDQDLARNHGFH